MIAAQADIIPSQAAASHFQERVIPAQE